MNISSRIKEIEREIMNKVSEKFNLELDEEVALMLIREAREQREKEIIDKIPYAICYGIRERVSEEEVRKVVELLKIFIEVELKSKLKGEGK